MAARRSRFMRSPWSRDNGGVNADSSLARKRGSHRTVPGSAGSPVTAPQAASGLSCSLRGRDGLRRRHRVGADELGGVAAAEQAGATADVEDVQGPAAGEDLELVRAVGVGDLYLALGGRSGAGDISATAWAGQVGLDAGDVAGRDASRGVEGRPVQDPREGAVGDREGEAQRAGAVVELERLDRAEVGPADPVAALQRAS